MRHILLVLSGKGGVGKSTLSTELALALRNAGKRVSEVWVLSSGFSLPAFSRSRFCPPFSCVYPWWASCGFSVKMQFVLV